MHRTKFDGGLGRTSSTSAPLRSKNCHRKHSLYLIVEAHACTYK